MITERNDITKIYLAEIRYNETLTNEQLLAIIPMAQSGDAKSISIIVNSLAKMVITVANKYKNTGEKLEDLIQAGNIGLVLSIPQFNLSKGENFISWAHTYIKREIVSYLSDNSRTIRQPRNRQKANKNVDKAMDELKLDGETNIEFLRDDESAYHNPARMSLQSLDITIGDDVSSQTLGDMIPSEEKEDDGSEQLLNVVMTNMSMITKKYQDLLRMHYLEEMSFVEISLKLNISREAVRLQHLQALRAIRSKILKNSSKK